MLSGSLAEIKSHYRGHKLSMWLSLIPQLHAPGDSVDLSMRHHHFVEESAAFYDGIVRPQSMQKPAPVKTMTIATTATTPTRTEATTSIAPVTSTGKFCYPREPLVTLRALYTVKNLHDFFK